ncbi:hypothetical protein Tco_1282634 [Tanacetum coccineum]
MVGTDVIADLRLLRDGLTKVLEEYDDRRMSLQQVAEQVMVQPSSSRYVLLGKEVISVKGVPWVGDGGVSGVSLSVVSSVDDKNGEIAGNGGAMIGVFIGYSVVSDGSGWSIHGFCGVGNSGFRTVHFVLLGLASMYFPLMSGEN